jgi:hypothetical protein
MKFLPIRSVPDKLFKTLIIILNSTNFVALNSTRQLVLPRHSITRLKNSKTDFFCIILNVKHLMVMSKSTLSTVQFQFVVFHFHWKTRNESSENIASIEPYS